MGREFRDGPEIGDMGRDGPGIGDRGGWLANSSRRRWIGGAMGGIEESRTVPAGE